MNNPIPRNKLNPKQSRIVALAIFAYAFVFIVCTPPSFFSEAKAFFPQLSFTLLMFITAGFLITYMNTLGLLMNKKAYLWLIPIGLLSMFASVFGLNLYYLFNYPMLFMLFVLFTIDASSSEGLFKRTQSILYQIFYIVIGRLEAFFELIADAFPKESEDENVKSKNAKKILIGLGAAFPFVFIILVLLIDADAVFGRVLGDAFAFFTSDFVEKLGQFLRDLIIMFIVFFYVSNYLYTTRTLKDQPARPRKFINPDSVTSITFLSALNVVFLLFSFFQLAFLFGGGFMRLPDGMIYSEYARNGFFQLLFVTVINFSVLMFYTFLSETKLLSKWVKRLLIALSLFTGVLVASSFYRMGLYIGVYGFTSLRVSVILFLVMEVFLLICTIAFLCQKNINYAKCFTIIVLASYVSANVFASNIFVTGLNLATHKLDYDIVRLESICLLKHAGTPLVGTSVPVDLKSFEDIPWQQWSLLEQISKNSLK